MNMTKKKLSGHFQPEVLKRTLHDIFLTYARFCISGHILNAYISGSIAAIDLNTGTSVPPRSCYNHKATPIVWARLHVSLVRKSVYASAHHLGQLAYCSTLDL